VVSSSGKILIVDDDDTVGRFLLRILSKDHQAEWVNNGGVALQRIAQGGYDVAIIDLGMPGMPGDQLMPHLKRLDSSLSTILITGWNLEDAPERREPFDFYLQKPFSDISLLHNAVQNAKALREQRHSAAE
jgi:CheY-like chemotaxis protein